MTEAQAKARIRCCANVIYAHLGLAQRSSLQKDDMLQDGWVSYLTWKDRLSDGNLRKRIYFDMFDQTRRHSSLLNTDRRCYGHHQVEGQEGEDSLKQISAPDVSPALFRRLEIAWYFKHKQRRKCDVFLARKILEGHTNVEIGALLGVTGSRVGQLVLQAFDKTPYQHFLAKGSA